MLVHLQKALGQAQETLKQASTYPLKPANSSNWYPDWKIPPKMPCADKPGLLCDGPVMQCATEYEPRRGHSLTEIRSTDTWKQQISPGDVGPYKANIQAGSGYVDNKMTYCGYAKDGWIEFNLHHVKLGRLIVCEPSYGWKRPGTVGKLAEEASFKSDGKDVKIKQGALDQKIVNGFCVQMDRTLPPGGGVFSIKAKSDAKMVCVSFLIWT
eukprot:TRINITY_DN18886_c0_g1_i2.p1 TRINITY_DN18886_c0_g1~~TRINITY_DN18886_c0_g1_i2.p1  ORF type:complete len:211 (+),score=28.91 TRINITY_DN18886_c0_g1_i2:122-754(+)